ncbi:MAG TPA: hypothetical protein VJ574_06065 [Candidatus Bathyarchaeia archaeon]|nr:hypothetical protein [Candidatus Bathyarchaeia archaeon]
MFKKSPATPVGSLKACDIFKDGQEFIVEDLEKPKGFCKTAWISIFADVRLLAFRRQSSLLQREGNSHQRVRRWSSARYLQTRTHIDNHARPVRTNR